MAALARLSLLGFALAVAGLAYLVVSRQLLAQHPVLLAVQVLAFLLMVWARITFGRRSFHAGADPTAGGLVTTGPYRFWRHPIYAAILYFVAAAVASHPHLDAAAAGLVIAAGLAVRMAAEERLVRATYPEYADYARRTKRVIPGVV